MSEEFKDPDPLETQEWLEAFEGVIAKEGKEKGLFLVEQMIAEAKRCGVDVPYHATTPYTNTLSSETSEKMPGDVDVARRVVAYVRWNAMAMVVRANRKNKGIGGHIASFSSSAALYEVGFNYFFRGEEAEHGGDLIFYQGHSAPGIYARAFVEGRFSEEKLAHFREEAYSDGLSSYPHPRLMPDFWQFPTVSMGLGPIMAIYQARFMKYMDNRGLHPAGKRKVWAFLGDGETDEPESRGSISLAARESLDNLIFVVNCNLQRLDGPVRGNGRIIQELEEGFRGAGWHVIKVLWGTEWDPLFAKDKKGLILKRMESMNDGEFQNLCANEGSFIRKHFFGASPELLALVEDLSDENLRRLSRGGLDPRKIYPAFAEAVRHEGSPVLILAHTVKGYGMGRAGEATNVTHNVKAMDLESLRVFRDRFRVPVADKDLETLPFIRPEEGSPEREFILAQRSRLGGKIPYRSQEAPPLPIPGKEAFKALLYPKASGREYTTTMAFVRLLGVLVKDKEIGRRIVPIVPDEARTFGMEGMFRQLGIYAPTGQKYTPQDADLVMWYREAKNGQILEEGINEAGAFCSWMAAGTAYSHYGEHMIPFYIYYSMFGFQRIGDLAWAAGDMMTRGFLIGAIAGRTTLSGEGLQHQDGQSLLLAATYPTCWAYDPTYAYELAIIVQNGLQKMYEEGEDRFYYITVQNEGYTHPALPKGVEEGIIKGFYLVREGKKGSPNVRLMGSGAVLRETLAAAEILEKEFSVSADVWSVLGINQLHRDGVETERWNRLNPEKKSRKNYVEESLAKRGTQGPVIISTDYVRAYPEQIRRLIPGDCFILGTDGFGRSDTRDNLRSFFEIDRYHVTLTALEALVKEGVLPAKRLSAAIKKYGVDPKKTSPLL